MEFEAPSDDELDFIPTVKWDWTQHLTVMSHTQSTCPEWGIVMLQGLQTSGGEGRMSRLPWMKIPHPSLSTEFVTNELINLVVEETNRYVQLICIAFLLSTLLLYTDTSGDHCNYINYINYEKSRGCNAHFLLNHASQEVWADISQPPLYRQWGGIWWRGLVMDAEEHIGYFWGPFPVGFHPRLVNIHRQVPMEI